MVSNSFIVESRKKVQSSTNSATGGEDFISRLPDDIITRVLSYVHTKSAVATCVLSKRWKDVWISVPNLDFNLYAFENGNQFENCVDRVLSLNNVLLVREIVLQCNYYRRHHDSDRVKAWFKSIVKRDAESFHLYLPESWLDEDITHFSSMNLDCLLPDRFFNQNRLVVLDIENVILKVPPFVCFPCLETIDLKVQLFDDESMKNLLLGCPVLKDLSITRKKWFQKQTLDIRSFTLRTLRLILYPDRNFNCDVVLNTPKLSCLRINDKSRTSSYDMVDISSLETASVHFFGSERKFYELLKSISHVRELSFERDSGMFLMLEKSREQLPKFHNLIQLKLVVHFLSELAVVWSCILPSTPDGVNIIFKLINGHPHCSWFEPLDLPDSVISTIESVEITIDDHREYLTVISCFIKNGTTLKTLTFHGFPVDVVNEDEFLKTFLPISKNKVRKLNRRFCDVSKDLGCVST